MTDAGSVVGIDFGTTYARIGAVVGGKVRLFQDAAGDDALPCAVAVGPGDELYVGRAAKRWWLHEPAAAISAIQQRIGAGERVALGGRRLLPVQLAALLFGALLDRAEAALGRRPSRAVVAVPATFSDPQRKATRVAAALAGIEVERLVHGPTAAVLSEPPVRGDEQRWMVMDLGGGGAEASIIERAAGLLEVQVSRGQRAVGGFDVDRALAELVLDQLGPSRVNIDTDPRALPRLLDAMERAKIALSTRDHVRLVDPLFDGAKARRARIDRRLHRRDLAEAARPYLRRVLACVDEALADAGVDGHALDRVLLVGGMSHVQAVQRALAVHLGRAVEVAPDPDRAVALGAARLAGRLAGSALEEVVVDITPYTLAVGVADEEYRRGEVEDLLAEPVIARDTVLPVERTKEITLLDEGPAGVAELIVVEGEEPRVGANVPVGRVRVGASPARRVRSLVEVTFRLDCSGMLHVHGGTLPQKRGAVVEAVAGLGALSEAAREGAREEVEALRAQGVEAGATPIEADFALARALCARAVRVLEASVEGSAAEQTRALMQALVSATERREPTVVRLYAALEEALLELPGAAREPSRAA